MHRWLGCIRAPPKQRVQALRHCVQHAGRQATLYVHWPFCARLCPYCDFNKYLEKSESDGMRECLLREFETMRRLYQIKNIKSVYFGGGTPSLAPASVFRDLLHTVFSQQTSNVEVSMEINPTKMEQSKLRDFKEAGVNRVSIGVQALNDEDLLVLGRNHTVKEAMTCYESACSIFEGSVSVDLMFGRPGQTLEQWNKELERLLSLGSNHVSLYQLTMKRGTPMEKQHRKKMFQLPSDDVLADMYKASVELLHSAGLKRYEVSNFARQGHRCNHNLSYWRGEDYMGIGPGAHGRLESPDGKSRHSLIQLAVPDHWMKGVKDKGHGLRKCVLLTSKQRLSYSFVRKSSRETGVYCFWIILKTTYEETVMLGLRCSEGVGNEQFESVVGWPLIGLNDDDIITSLIQEDLIELDDISIRATHSGLSLLDSLVTEVLLAIERVNERRVFLNT